MEETKQPRAAIWAIAIAIATAILTYWRTELKLNSSRPVFTGQVETSTVGEQKILARLWEDPFAILKRTNQSTLPATLAAEISNSNCSNILAIAVDGYPYAENVEVRLRIRYAVEAALFARGYVWKDGGHLGLVDLTNWPDTQCLWAELHHKDKTGQTSHFQIPFEWTQKSTNRDDLVLVLWLQDQQLADYPLKRCQMIMTNFGLTTNNGVAKFRFVGPRSSDTLASFLQDLTNIPTDSNAPVTSINTNWVDTNILNNMSIYSAYPSAPDVLLPTNAASSNLYGNPRRSISNEFSRHCISFTNFVTTDDQLALRLVDELKLRQIDLADTNRNYTVLVSESDSAYGRDLPLCFAAAVMQRSIVGLDNRATNDDISSKLLSLRDYPDTWPPNVLQFWYLRGLDGVGVGETASKSIPDRKPLQSDENPSPGRGPEEFEHAEGRSQLDYARRLARKIEEGIPNYRFGGIRLAIGLVGTDTYDKLVLLKALRNRFKDAIFFTTDLDARYSDPQDIDVTRNLIVASREGLSPQIPQRTNLTFRYAYQTTLFHACCAALGDTTELTNVYHGKIFEIGLHKPIDLEGPNEEWFPNPWWWQFLLFGVAGFFLYLRLTRGGQRVRNSWRTRLRQLTACFREKSVTDGQHSRTTQPAIPPRPSTNQNVSDKLKRFFKKFALALRVDAEQMLQDEGRRFSNKAAEGWERELMEIHRGEDKIFLGVHLTGLFVLLLFAYRFQTNNEPPGWGSEPFFWFEGVSIWPTELVLVGAIFYGVLSLIHSWHIYRRYDLSINREFFCREEDDEENGCQLLTANDIRKPERLVQEIKKTKNSVSRVLRDYVHWVDLEEIGFNSGRKEWEESDTVTLVRNLNQAIVAEDHALSEAFEEDDKPEGVDGDENGLKKEIRDLIALKPHGLQLVRLNRLIIEYTFEETIRRRHVRIPKKLFAGGARLWRLRSQHLRTVVVLLLFAFATVLFLLFGWHGLLTSVRVGQGWWLKSGILIVSLLVLSIWVIRARRQLVRLNCLIIIEHTSKAIRRCHLQMPGINKDAITAAEAGEKSIYSWGRDADYVNAERLFESYQNRARFWNRFLRTRAPVVSFVGFSLGLFFWFGWHRLLAPVRGGLSLWLEPIILVVSLLVFSFLAFYVIDATRLTEGFLRNLGGGITRMTRWPGHLVTRLALERNMDPAHLSWYLDVKLVAHHTQELGRIVYYPFVMLAIMVFARNQVFAPWTWPYDLLIIYLATGVMVFLCAFHIRRVAARIRQQAIDSLRDVEARMTAGFQHEHNWTVRVDELDESKTVKHCSATNYHTKIEQMIQEIEEIDTGAYAKLLRDDSILAALIPALGAAFIPVIRTLFLSFG
jgi:hypothetical protein